ncbi:MAG: M23 family metallopeptidase [Deltaproteobacteria bacterium]
MESTPPVVAIDLQSPAIGAEKTLHLQVRDPQSGLKHVWVGIFSNGKESTLLEKKFSTAGFLKAGLTKSADFDINIQAKALGLKDGAATLRLVAVDHSWQQWGKGNRTYLEKEVVIDTQPPRIEVLSKAHNINPGGAGLVLYKLSEPCRKSGVMVGDTFYSGYEWTVKDSRIMLAFFALSHLQGSNTKIHLAAADNAGNSSRAGFYYHIRNRHFKQDTIRISDRFLAAKLPEFRDYQNRNIDDEFHLGVDLASTANSPVPAANKGKVVFAGRIGIYGNIILIDHGFGLFSMYGHLSRMDVEPGQMVDKGSIIGKTGATGLAGGDHLHFAMMVHQTFVNPVEWWDASWIKNNITDKLASIGG